MTTATAAQPSVLVTDDRDLRLLGPALAADVTSDEARAALHLPTTWRPDQSLITGRFVQATIPNANGHIYDVDELRAEHGTVVHTGANMGHDHQALFGTFIRSEWNDDAAGRLGAPYTDVAAVYFKKNRPQDWGRAMAAIATGSAFWSKESRGRSITCITCGETHAWKGPTHPTYCQHLQVLGPPARINQPLFTGGALIVPPQRPGWQFAAIDEVVAAHQEESEAIYDAVAAMAPHLPPLQAEAAMALVVAGIHPTEVPAEAPRIHHVNWDPVVAELADASLGFGTVDVAAAVGAAPVTVTAPPGDHHDHDLGVAIVAELDRASVVRLTADEVVEQPAHEIHCTLAYLGRHPVPPGTLADQVDQFAVGDVPGARVEALVAAVATVGEPLVATVSSVTAWSEGDGSAVVVALVDAPRLGQARELLVETLERAGVEIPENHGFTAHVTLASASSVDDVDLDRYAHLAGATFTLRRWAVWWGDVRRASFPTGVGLDPVAPDATSR